MRNTLAVAIVALLLNGCSSPSTTACTGTNCSTVGSNIRSITNQEAAEDFDEITTSFKGLYGALTRKEQRYNFQFDALAASYRNRIAHSTSEATFRGLFQQFLAEFHDPHISLYADLEADTSNDYQLPFFVMPIGNTYVVYHVNSSLGPNPPLNVGDELLSIDGVTTADLVAKFLPYAGVANPLTAAHFASLSVTYRPLFLSQGLSAGSTAHLKLRNAAGNEYEAAVGWIQLPHYLPVMKPAPAAGASTAATLRFASEPTAQVVNAEMTAMGARVPFFMTPQVRAALGITREVQPSAQALAKYGLSATQAAAINYFATTYSLNAKTILFLRLPDYDPSSADDSLNYIRALFDEQQPLVDGLIFDETHNPGGKIAFAAGVATLLAQQTFNGFVQEMHGDRDWIDAYATDANQLLSANPQDPFGLELQNRANEVDAAYSANQPLSVPIPLFFPGPTMDPDPSHWAKPVVVLTDELSVSCADFLPAIVKNNHLAPLFGQTTMGGGGNVEQVMTLTNTQAQLSISRGLGTVYDPTGAYPDSRFIEDNGVAPDYPYSHTLDDFRAGFVGYVNTFNSVLSSQMSSN